MYYRLCFIFLILTSIITKSNSMNNKITKHTFDNGLILIHKKTEPLPIVEIELFINVGSFTETEKNSGITNLVQTLLLKGTKNRTAEQIAIEIESIGGTISSDSDDDYSTISVSIPSKHFSEAITILSDVLLNPNFPQEELEKEKKVILAAIKSREDHIFNVASDTLIKNLYKEHPYSMINLGNYESIKNITRNDIINWYNRYYGTPNIIIVVVGNVSFKETINNVKKRFSTIPKVQNSKVILKEPELVSNETITLKKKFEQSYLMYGYLVPQINNNDYPVLKVLNTYLGSGMSSQLFQELREKSGLCYETGSFYPSKKYTSRFIIYLGLDKSKINEAKKKIDSIIDELKLKKISENKLDEIKNHIKGVYLLDHQRNSRQAWFLGWWEILGKGYEYDEQYLTDITKVNSEDIVKVANKYFNKNHVIVEILPEK